MPAKPRRDAQVIIQFACMPYRVLIIALSIFRPYIDRLVRVKELSYFLRLALASGRTLFTRRMTSVNFLRPLETIDVQCPRWDCIGRTVLTMDEGRCPTCEALGRRSLSTKLLQVATTQAHVRTCAGAGSQPEESDLASRALAAKRRKSIAVPKFTLPSESMPRQIVAEQPRSPFARRNTWCS